LTTEAKEEISERKLGRPMESPGGGKVCSLYLPKELIPKLKALGGSRWVAEQIRKAKLPDASAPVSGQ